MPEIKTVGVCGSGVMGSQLAALFAGAGLDVFLFDLDQELAERGLQGALKAKPAAFYHRRFAKKIVPSNYEDHLDRFGECDWVIEAIAERLDWKHGLYKKIQPHLKDGALLSSNTSGLSMHELAEALPADLRQRFLITHFFNPPRYMRLVELVRAAETDEAVVLAAADLIGRTLGKGIVHAKDTPNFIANRIGVYGMMLALELTAKMRLSVEEVDAVTGPVMGRPKSATYRTADIVGLDTLAFVAKTAYDKCEGDEARMMFETPPVLAKLLERKSLGQKSGEGFYKKDGKKILALDLETLEYRPKTKPRMDGIGVGRRFTDLGRKMEALVFNPDPAGNFAWELTIGTLAYAARRLGEVADDVTDIDRAMRWGFGWEQGPFEVWDSIGVERSVRRMEGESKPVPELVKRLLSGGKSSFYDRNGTQRYFDLASETMMPVETAPDVIQLEDRKAAGGELLRNWSASLIDLGDGVGCIEFHSALQPDFNPVDGAILDMLAASLDAVHERSLEGLVISHEGMHFCAGANLALILELARSNRFEVIEEVSATFQKLSQAIKYAPFPVVAAPFSVSLGGGFEVIAACDRVVALAELYCGAVEVGVGLIPGAGGNLRLLTNLSRRLPPTKMGPMAAVQKTFETIGFAKVSTSAHEAVELGYLRKNSRIVLSREHLIARAKQEVLELANGYQPPEPPELIPPGVGGRLAIQAVIDNYVKAGTISEHDALVAGKLAHVITGGERANGVHPVEEQHFL
ncbi:MAG: 3-hydroxyacyl-CoA dehydrogenase/enoyl-CoA hydratase family protein, partial [Acidobacteriota bacterium]|nr:3-hydroxyacyl-CoA dehydrogenase/enoyl-CoA hydratase family protein [Acidobacteriota bacterium]